MFSCYFTEALCPIRNVENIDIEYKFYDVLSISFKAVIIQKRGTFPEELKETIKLYESKMDKLYYDVKSSTETNFINVLALATSYIVTWL